jgi:two-component system sensor histidine kinase/response regulator
MPELDGLQATKHIRAFEQETNRPAVPVVALTANGMKDAEENCFQSGMNGYLLKPFNQKELSAVVCKFLA